MKLSRSKLRQLILEEFSLAVVHPAESPCDVSRGATLSEVLADWLGRLRAIQLWFHTAHIVVSGPSFAGDHVNLYGRIYTEIQEALDADIEKAVGVTGDVSVACSHKLVEIAHEVLEKYPSPSVLDAETVASTALKMVHDHIGFVEQTFEDLESSGELTLGLNDHLAAQANTFESYVYLLRQRAGSPGM